MSSLTNKIALVTGGSRGIGRAISLELAKNGAKVALSYLSGEVEANAIAQQIKDLGADSLVVYADVSHKGSARDLVNKVINYWGTLDILVNNAGITRDKTLKKLTDEDWEEVIATNLNGVYYTVSAVLPTMLKHNYGRIINISSYAGQAGNFGQANYAASTGGIIAFTKSAAIELAKNNITVNAVAPGFTVTDMLDKVSEPVQQKIIAKIPMGRFGQPEEIAKAVRFLAADGDYITGQQINVNGGVYM
jgi:acetoacetyl-CoA reductase